MEILRFAFDLENLYLRVEGDMTPLFDENENGAFIVEFKRPRELRLVFTRNSVTMSDKQGQTLPFSGAAALEQVLEFRIPFETVGAEPGDVVEFFLMTLVKENTVDRLPQSGFVVTERPKPSFGQENWNV